MLHIFLLRAVYYKRVPGHIGIKGNIEADILACDTSDVITQILPIPYSDILPTLQSIIVLL